MNNKMRKILRTLATQMPFLGPRLQKFRELELERKHLARDVGAWFTEHVFEPAMGTAGYMLTNLASDKKCIRVVQVNYTEKKGGAAQVCHALHRFLPDNVDRTMIVASKTSDDPTIEQLQPSRPELERLLLRYGRQEGMRGFASLSGLGLPSHPKVKGADIVHLHNLHADYFNMFSLPPLTRMKKVIWTLHDEWAFTEHCGSTMGCDRWFSGCETCPFPQRYLELPFDTGGKVWQLKRKVYDQSDLTLVTPSHWLKERVEKSIMSRFSVHVIPNGVDTHIFHPRDRNTVRRELGLPCSAKIVLFCADAGFSNPWKGGNVIGAIWEQMRNRWKQMRKSSGLFLVIIGGEKRKRRRHSMEAGYIEDRQTLAKYYAGCDIVLYPTEGDNLPLTVLESMACGTPVISFGVGGIPEIVGHWEDGLLLKPGNFEEFAEGAFRLLDDDKFRQDLSYRARKKIETYFSLDNMVREYSNLYQKLCNKECKD